MENELKVTMTSDGLFIEAKGEAACNSAARIFGGKETSRDRKEVDLWPRPSSIQEMLRRGDHLDAAEAAAKAVLDDLLDTFGDYSPLAQVVLADTLKDRLGDTTPAGGPTPWGIAGPSPEMIAQILAQLKSRRSGGGSWEEVAELANDAQGAAAPSDSAEPSGDAPEGKEGGDFPDGVANMK